MASSSHELLASGFASAATTFESLELSLSHKQRSSYDASKIISESPHKAKLMISNNLIDLKSDVC